MGTGANQRWACSSLHAEQMGCRILLLGCWFPTPSLESCRGRRGWWVLIVRGQRTQTTLGARSRGPTVSSVFVPLAPASGWTGGERSKSRECPVGPTCVCRGGSLAPRSVSCCYRSTVKSHLTQGKHQVGGVGGTPEGPSVKGRRPNRELILQPQFTDETIET